MGERIDPFVHGRPCIIRMVRSWTYCYKVSWLCITLGLASSCMLMCYESKDYPRELVKLEIYPSVYGWFGHLDLITMV